jgi:putative acetyltransferase
MPDTAANNSVRIRSFAIGDEPALWAVFHSAIHELASKDYSAEQVNAWAPDAFDDAVWAGRMRGIRPFVAERAGKIIAYADLQASGCIDHFFVCGPCAGRGVGGMLMRHILAAAAMQGIAMLTSDVSLTAQPFYQRFGFVIVERRLPVIRGVALPNALMRKTLAGGPPRAVGLDR